MTQSQAGSAGAHAPVLAAEAIEMLNVKPDGVYVDATFGRGGHSRRMLSALGPNGRLIALDRDPQAIAAAAAIEDKRFTCVHARFSRLAPVLDQLSVGEVDGVLLDLGVSSPQLEEAERGFSFRRDGPLDMRMDPTGSDESAQDWLNRAAQEEIEEVVRRYGEERFARQIARAIVAARAERRIGTTGQLAAIVSRAVRTREPGQDPATRTFQALRLYINQELEEVALVLPMIESRLAPSGRMVVISFHSLEDRLVKQFMRAESSPPQLPARLPVRAAEIGSPKMRLIGKPIRPNAAEVARNPRARSAIMRTAERI